MSDYSDPSSYYDLDHGVDFLQPFLHWMLHQTDQARKEYGPKSQEYLSMLSRLTNQLGLYADGGNFTMKEYQHYDSEHTESMAAAAEMLQSMFGIPFQQYLEGFNWTSVLTKLGNADGSPYTSQGNNLPRPQPLQHPLKLETGKDGRQYMGGIEIRNRPMAARAVSSAGSKAK